MLALMCCVFVGVSGYAAVGQVDTTTYDQIVIHHHGHSHIVHLPAKHLGPHQNGEANAELALHLDHGHTMVGVLNHHSLILTACLAIALSGTIFLRVNLFSHRLDRPPKRFVD